MRVSGLLESQAAEQSFPPCRRDTLGASHGQCWVTLGVRESADEFDVNFGFGG